MSSKKKAVAKIVHREWSLNERVLCRYATSDVYYEAKIIDVQKENDSLSYLIHYQGWNSRYDEEIDQHDANLRFKPYTPEDAKRARDIIKQAQQERKRSTSTKTRQPRSNKNTVQSNSKEMVSAEPEEEKEKIVLPFSLRKILTDDCHLINKENMLPKFPARVTVEQIIEEYKKSLSETEPDETFDFEFFVGNPRRSTTNDMINPCTDSCKKSADGFIDYFNMTVGSMLLYKIERPVYAELYKQETEKMENDPAHQSSSKKGLKSKKDIHYSRYFGLVHLLRMFTRFTDMLEYTNWSARAMNAIVRHAQKIVTFLSERHAEFYDINDYELVSPEYLKSVWGSEDQA